MNRLYADKIYVIVNGVTAELHGLYQDRDQCVADCDIMNTLGVYMVLTLQEHIDALMTWFGKGLEDTI